MKTRLLVAVLVMAAVFTAAVPALASEEIDLDASLLDDISAGYTDKEAESILGITSLGDVSASDLLSSIQASSISGGVLSLSECLNAFGGTNYSFDEVYELTSLGIALNNVDVGLLNTSYNNAASSMANTYNTLDLSGSSVSCAQLFTEKYGDLLDSLSISYATIPSGFDTSAMLQSASSQLSSLYSSATNSGTFSSVKNSISIGNIFAQAAAGPTTYDLAFTSAASSMYDTFSNYDSLYAASGFTGSDEYSQYKKNAGYIAASDALAARNEALNAMGGGMFAEYVYETDEDGNYIFDENGNLIPETDEYGNYVYEGIYYNEDYFNTLIDPTNTESSVETAAALNNYFTAENAAEMSSMVAAVTNAYQPGAADPDNGIVAVFSYDSDYPINYADIVDTIDFYFDEYGTFQYRPDIANAFSDMHLVQNDNNEILLVTYGAMEENEWNYSRPVSDIIDVDSQADSSK